MSRLGSTAYRPLTPSTAAAALRDLAVVISQTRDEALHSRLQRIYDQLDGPDSRGTIAADGRLSPRELDALRLAATGACNMEIAAELQLSPETVKSYLRTAMQKLGAPNRTAAAHAARLAGML